MRVGGGERKKGTRNEMKFQERSYIAIGGG